MTRGVYGQFIPKGTKQCRDCKVVQPLSEFHVKTRNPDGTPRTYQSYCKPCGRARVRVSLGLRRRGRPFGLRQPALTREQAKERRRERRRERIAKERDYHERLKRNARRAARERKRAKGPVREYNLRTSDAYTKSVSRTEWLPAEPFVQWVAARFRSSEEAAQVLGVSSRSLRHLLSGEHAHVQLTMVDQAFTTLGRPDLLNAMYPVDDARTYV